MGRRVGGRRTHVDRQGSLMPEIRSAASTSEREVRRGPGTAAGGLHLGLVLRTVAAIALLVVAYYQAPLDRPLTFASGVFFLGALVLAALVLVVEVRGILASTQPMLRAVRVIALGLPLLLVLFAATYITVEGQQADAFSSH